LSRSGSPNSRPLLFCEGGQRGFQKLLQGQDTKKMNLLDRVYKKNDAMVSRKIGDEFILVPIRQNVGDLESIYTLNETAARIWESIDGKTRVKEIREKIVGEFDVTSEEAEKDLLEHLQQLEAIKAIREG
jgi:hypothetical protein